MPEVTINVITEGVILTKFDTSFEEVRERCNFNRRCHFRCENIEKISSEV